MAMFALGVNAKSVKTDFSTVLKDSGVDTESIAISIKVLHLVKRFIL